MKQDEKLDDKHPETDKQEEHINETETQDQEPSDMQTVLAWVTLYENADSHTGFNQAIWWRDRPRSSIKRLKSLS